MFLSGRIKEEFSIYRVLSGGDFHISIQKVLNSLSLQQIELLIGLELDKNIYTTRKQRMLFHKCCSINQKFPEYVFQNI